MSNENLGKQDIYINYKLPTPAKAQVMNKWFHNVLRPGLYHGGEVTIINNITISVAPFTVLCETPTGQLVKVQTKTNILLEIKYDKPFIVCSFEWDNIESPAFDSTLEIQPIGNFMVVGTKNRGEITHYDIIIAKADYVGSQIIGINYNWQTRVGLMTDIPTVGIPHSNPLSGWISYNQEIYLDSWTPETEIWYTLDGSTPERNGVFSFFYQFPIHITLNFTMVRAIAFRHDMLLSNVMQEIFQFPVMPSINEPDGWISWNTPVTFSTPSVGANIYYTIDGSTPDETKILYVSPINVIEDIMFKAITIYNEFTSQIFTIEYKVPIIPETTINSIITGTLQPGDTIELSTDTPEAQIYYTTNGSTPTSGDTLYTIPIVVGIQSDLTLKAIAIVDDGVNEFTSQVLTETYDILSEPVATPTSNWISYNDTVALSTYTPSSTIRYTLNGLTPNLTSTLYISPIPITQSLTLKAIAIMGGVPSTVLTESYQVVATPTASPNTTNQIVETTVSLSTITSVGTVNIYYTTNGSTPTSSSTLYTTPIELNTIGNITIKAIAIKDGLYSSNILTQNYTVYGYNVDGLIVLTGIISDVTNVSVKLQLSGVDVGSPTNPDIDGYYNFTDLYPGNNYKVIAELSGWDPISSNLFNITNADKIVETLYIFASRLFLLGNPTYAYSNDGINWTLDTHPYPGNYKMTFNNGKYIGVEGNNVIYSDDGINWNQVSIPIGSGTEDYQSITYGNGKFVVVSNTSDDVAYSNDGITWNVTTLPSSNTWNSVIWSGDKFIAINSTDETTAYSDDGVIWYTGTPFNIVLTGWKDIVYGNGFVYVINSNTDDIAFSQDDGLTWTTVSGSFLQAGEYWATIIYANEMFIMISQGETGAYSLDGITWNDFTLPYNQDWSNITYNNGKFIAISSDNTDQAAESIDGITWTSYILPAVSNWIDIISN